MAVLSLGRGLDVGHARHSGRCSMRARGRPAAIDGLREKPYVSRIFTLLFHNVSIPASEQKKTPGSAHPLKLRGCCRGPEQRSLDITSRAWPVHRPVPGQIRTGHSWSGTAKPAYAHPDDHSPGWAGWSDRVNLLGLRSLRAP